MVRPFFICTFCEQRFDIHEELKKTPDNDLDPLSNKAFSQIAIGIAIEIGEIRFR